MITTETIEWRIVALDLPDPGEPVLAWSKSWNRPYECVYNGGSDWWSMAIDIRFKPDGQGEEPPSHWMPIPQGPRYEQEATYPEHGENTVMVGGSEFTFVSHADPKAAQRPERPEARALREKEFEDLIHSSRQNRIADINPETGEFTMTPENWELLAKLRCKFTDESGRQCTGILHDENTPHSIETN